MTNNDSTDRCVSTVTWVRVQDLLTVLVNFCALMVAMGLVIGAAVGILASIRSGGVNGFRLGMVTMFLFTVLPALIGMGLSVGDIAIDTKIP